MAKNYVDVLTSTLDEDIRWKKLGLHKYELYNNYFHIEVETYAVIDFLCLGENVMYEDEFREIDEEGNLCCTNINKPLSSVMFLGVQ